MTWENADAGAALQQARPPRRSGATAAVPGASAAITVEGVSKAFRVPRQRHTSVKERVTHPLARASSDVVPALRDVSFRVDRGELFGIAGRNGSGKSTLLRCIAGIYRPDAGTVHVEAPVAPFIELGLGFSDAMSARDNAIVAAVMLGMTRRQARDALDRIFAFAELERFMDVRVKNLSSGMALRLAFAITVEIDADVFLFDEVLGVGDARFQRKCFDRLQAMRDQGRTIVLVTHDMRQVERFCDRAMVLEGGEIVDVGDPARVARR